MTVGEPAAPTAETNDVITLTWKDGSVRTVEFNGSLLVRNEGGTTTYYTLTEYEEFRLYATDLSDPSDPLEDLTLVASEEKNFCTYCPSYVKTEIYDGTIRFFVYDYNYYPYMIVARITGETRDVATYISEYALPNYQQNYTGHVLLDQGSGEVFGREFTYIKGMYYRDGLVEPVNYVRYYTKEGDSIVSFNACWLQSDLQEYVNKLEETLICTMEHLILDSTTGLENDD